MARSNIAEVEKTGELIKDRKFDSPQTSDVRSVDREEWDNTGLRKRLDEARCSAKYEIVDIELIELPKEKGKFAKFQYRRKRTRFAELKESIARIGVYEDITLQKVTGSDGVVRYYIIDGHTRFLAFMEVLKEDPTVPVPLFRVIECSDADAAQIAVELNRFQENFDDEDKNALIIRLYEEAKLAQKDIAELLGCSPARVSEVIGAFQNVPPAARDKIESRSWRVESGIQLARLKGDTEEQQRICDNAIASNYSASKMTEFVDASIARTKLERAIRKAAKDTPLKGIIKGETTGTVTSGTVEKFHQKAMGTIAERDMYGGDDHIFRHGSARIEVTVGRTKKVLKDMGYTIVDGDATAVDVTKPEKPKMPGNMELMDTQVPLICGICNGRIHPFVKEAVGFDSKWTNYHSTRAHTYCAIKKEIEDLQKQLAKDPITVMLEKDSELTLAKINKRANALYKEELDRRKQKWHEERLPKPSKTEKGGSKVGEPVTPKQFDAKTVFEKVRKKYPKLVSNVHYDAFGKRLDKEKGWISQNDVVASMTKLGQKGATKGTVNRAFQKISAKMAEEVADKK